MENSNQPGTLRWLISCDESGVGGERYFGFGSLWMKWQRRGDFASDFRNLCDNHNYRGECKWNKAHSYKAQGFFSDLIEYFFKRSWLAFHCFVVRKGAIDKSLHDGNYDLARRKLFTMFLANKIERCMQVHPNREHTFRIWVDPIASRYKKADEVVEIISNRILAQASGREYPIDSIITRNSKDTPTIQICDFLLGAVMDAWQQKSSSEIKAKLQQKIAQHLGWRDLRADTYPDERKFNIWYFYDPTLGSREIQTRKVNLKYPLPK